MRVNISICHGFTELDIGVQLPLATFAGGPFHAVSQVSSTNTSSLGGKDGGDTSMQRPRECPDTSYRASCRWAFASSLNMKKGLWRDKIGNDQ